MKGKIFSHTIIKGENGKFYRFYETGNLELDEEVTFELKDNDTAINVTSTNIKVNDNTNPNSAVRDYIRGHRELHVFDKENKSNFSYKADKMSKFDTTPFVFQGNTATVFTSKILATFSVLFFGIFAFWFYDFGLKISISERGADFSVFKSLEILRGVGLTVVFFIAVILSFLAVCRIAKISKSLSLCKKFINAFKYSLLVLGFGYAVLWAIFKYKFVSLPLAQEQTFLGLYAFSLVVFLWSIHDTLQDIAVIARSQLFRAFIPLVIVATILIFMLPSPLIGQSILALAFAVYLLAWWFIRRVGI